MMGALGLAGYSAWLSGCSKARVPEEPRPVETRSVRARSTAQITVADWVSSRPGNYFVAHRGSGDVYPEHSMPAYQAAFDAGAQCMEVSVDITADGVPICMHDLTYDRTTTGHGVVAREPSSVLRRIRIRQPQLGPYWLRHAPPVPRLRDVLETFGGHVVLCLEAKDDRAYRPMMGLVEELELRNSVIVKAYWTSRRIRAAKAQGYPVFAYLGPEDMKPARIAAIARGLDPLADYLVLPATAGDELTYYPDALIAGAVAYGVPVWIYPVHRRVDAAHYFGLGVAGAVTSSYRYVSGNAPTATSDDWAGKRVAPGEMSRQPDRASTAPEWTGRDELTLAAHGTQQFVTLGEFSPIAAAHRSYRITFLASWPVLPADRESNLTLAFGHADDAYYEHRLGKSNGYHALIRPDGRLQLYRHAAGEPDGTLLDETTTPAPEAGRWMSFQLDVSPEEIRWSRTDVAPPAEVRARDSSIRGGYLHIGRSAWDDRSVAAFRNFVVSE